MDTREPRKVINERSVTFKKKDAGLDKRNLRAHRRSIEWKQKREETVNLRRGDIVSPLSPLKELHTNMEEPNPKLATAIVNPTKSTEPIKSKAQKAAEERREMLEKWRKEKELKKKLEAQQNAKKRCFKVAHVDKALLSSRKFNDIPKPHPKVVAKKSPVLLKGRKALPKSPKLLASANKRVTRSQTSKATDNRTQTRDVKPVVPKKETKTVENKKLMKNKPQVNSTDGKQLLQTKQVSSHQMKNVDSTKKRPGFTRSSTNQFQPKPTNNSRVSKMLDHNKRDQKMQDSITCFRGSRISSSEMSFAPTDFKFSAPSNLQSFVFQPLSPTSAAEFLVPGNDLSKLTPPSTKRCSTPISQSKKLNSGKKLHNSESSGDENTKNDGKKTSNRGRSQSKVRSKEPVMSVEQEAMKSPTSKSGKVEQQPQAMEVDHEKAELAKDMPSQEASEKNNQPKTEVQKTPGRRKSVRKSHASEPMPRGKTITQSLPDAEIYGSKVACENSNLENQPPLPSVTDGGSLADNVFRTPGPTAPSTKTKRGRTRSLGTALLLSNSAKKFKTPRNNRNSLILGTLSPEEGVKVLENSPMIVLTRRTPKLHQSPINGAQKSVEPMPSFDDIEEELAAAEKSLHEESRENNSVTKETVNTTESSEATTEVQTRSSIQTDPAVTMSEEPCRADITEDVTMRTQCDNSQATLVVNRVTQVASKEEESTLPLVQSDSTVQHDVPYFRQIQVTESQKLQALCDKWEELNVTSTDLTEEARGQIRTAIGKAQLLMAQRFKQFSGLVDNCEFNTGEKKTTCTDLEGFWEMIYFQVEDVHRMFADLDKKQANGWKCDEHTEVVKKKIVKKKVNVKPSKPGTKSKFAEFRAKMKQQQTQKSDEVIENKTFVSGIFRIDSPVKKITPHCEGGSPGKLGKRVSSRGNTPCGSPLLKAVMERNARKSHGPSPLLQEVTCPKTPATQSDGKRKRRPSSDSNDTPAKVTRVENEHTGPKPVFEGKSIFSPDTSAVKQSKRRSLRRSIRKSVSWDKTGSTDSPMKDSAICDVEPSTNNIMSQFLQPTVVQESDMEVDSALSPEDVDMSAVSKRALKSEFDKHSSSAKKGNTPRRRSMRLLSAEKSLSSQRRSRRSVHFSSNLTEDSPIAVKMPVTPFHRDASVGRTRRSSRHSVGMGDCLFSPLRTTNMSSLDTSTTSPLTPLHSAVSDLRTAEEKVASPATRLAKLNVNGTPSERGSSTRSTRRVSGFTPPQKISPPVSSLESVMETADLMSFSPGPNGKAAMEGTTSRTPRRSLRPRVSLL